VDSAWRRCHGRNVQESEEEALDPQRMGFEKMSYDYSSGRKDTMLLALASLESDLTSRSQRNDLQAPMLETGALEARLRGKGLGLWSLSSARVSKLQH
jgi:hypothetical protein